MAALGGIYTLVAAAIYIAATSITGDRSPSGALGEFLLILTDSTTILILIWVVGCLLIVLNEQSE
jgi:hypothetical protein